MRTGRQLFLGGVDERLSITEQSDEILSSLSDLYFVINTIHPPNHLL